MPFSSLQIRRFTPSWRSAWLLSSTHLPVALKTDHCWRKIPITTHYAANERKGLWVLKNGVKRISFRLRVPPFSSLP
jgi:hypothetical protein